MAGINALSNVHLSSVNFKHNIEEEAQIKESRAIDKELSADEAKFSTKTEKPAPPEISTIRLMFSRLTDEQIAQINDSGKLHENAKFVMNGYGGYTICNNFFNLRVGTRELPQGFEVKKNVMGFATVLPKGAEGAFIKKANS